jgi:tetratricopeptide (TPR) repeat protein
MAISQTANRDAKAALERLLALPPTARATLGKTAKSLELDLRVFGLNDPLVVGLATRLSKSSDKKLARMARIRLGDYHLLNGRIDEAAHWFAKGAPGRGDAQRSNDAGAIDASHALAIEEFITTNHLDEARAKLEEWELLRPAAKIDGAQLLWRARVMFLAGAWPRASQDLQTSLKVRPSSPEKWDVLFWQGRALYALELKEEARMIWNGMVKDFPNHEGIESAKAWALKP